MTETAPAYAYLHSNCIEIKISLKTEPVKLDSPIECYACIGKIRKAYNLPCELTSEVLDEEIASLKSLIANQKSPSERIDRICQILFAFHSNTKTEEFHRIIMEYAYHNEK